MGVIKKVVVGKREEIAIRYQYDKKPVFFYTNKTRKDDIENNEKVSVVLSEVLNAVTAVMNRGEQPTNERVYKEFHTPKVTDNALGFSTQLDASDMLWNFYSEAKRSGSKKEKYNPERIKMSMDLVSEFQEETGIYFLPFNEHNETTLKPFSDNFSYWLLVKKMIPTNKYMSIMDDLARGLRFGCKAFNPSLGKISDLIRKYEIPPYTTEGYFKPKELIDILYNDVDADHDSRYYINRLAFQCMMGDPNLSDLAFNHRRISGVTWENTWRYYGKPLEFQNPESNNYQEAPKELRDIKKLHKRCIELMGPMSDQVHLWDEERIQKHYRWSLRDIGYKEPVSLAPTIDQAAALILPTYKSVDDQFILQSHIALMLHLGFEPFHIQSDVREDFKKHPHNVFMALIANYNAGLGTKESPFQYRVPMVQVKE